MAEKQGPVYLRISRVETPDVTQKTDPFEVGKARILKPGKKVSIIACGTMVSVALKAAEKINGEVINLSTVKPLDKATILRSVKKTKKVITIEEHSVIGGMGSAVAEMLAQEFPVPIKIMGISDIFGQSARDYQQLLDKYGLTAENIIRSFKELK
jgi:transketolase